MDSLFDPIIFIVFYFLPFLIGVILPTLIIPFLILLRKENDNANLFFTYSILFVPSLIILAILTNLFWNSVLYNKVYYEWDRIFLPYTFFSHEAPLLDGMGTWIAPGWTLNHLYLVWFLLTLGIYILSGLIALSFNRSKDEFKEQKKFISQSIIGLTIASIFMSLVFPDIMVGLLFIFFQHP